MIQCWELLSCYLSSLYMLYLVGGNLRRPFFCGGSVESLHMEQD